MRDREADTPITRSLSDRAYEQIRYGIVRCQLEPGSQVTEGQLTERYGIGRAAVRTALNRLVQERLVQAISRQGYVIAPITLKGVRDLFAVRLLLEPDAAQLAAGRVNVHELRRLDQLCQAAHYQLGDRESAGAFLQANTEFHVTLAQASGNERLATIIAGLLDEMERLFHLGLMLRDRNDEMYHEHHELIEALRAGDGLRARQVAADQIRTAQKMVTDALLSSPNLETVNLAPI